MEILNNPPHLSDVLGVETHNPFLGKARYDVNMKAWYVGMELTGTMMQVWRS
jgi:hypothetical protein